MRLACASLALLLAASVAAADAAVDPSGPPGPPAPRPSELIVLSRDGAVTRVGAAGEARALGKFAAPRALATLPGGRVAVLAGGKLQIFDGKAWRPAPGDYADARDLAACGAKIYLSTDDEIFELELRGGKRTWLMRGAGLGAGRLLCGGDWLYYERAGVVDALAGPEPKGVKRWPWSIPGHHPRALAADGATVYAATREGPLWRYDFARGGTEARDLGMGGWWGTLALAADTSGLYAVTQAGKLWHIDPARSAKTIIAMSGWEAALALAVSR